MKDSKLSQELTQLIVVLVVVYLVIMVLATFFIQNFYVSLKFEQLQSYYNENAEDITETQLINYATSQGFTNQIVSKEEVQRKALDSFNSTNPDDEYHQLFEKFNEFAGNTSSEQADHPFESNYDSTLESITFVSNEDIITLSLNTTITNDIIFITVSIVLFTTILFLAMIIIVNVFVNKRVGRPLEQLSNYIDDIAKLNHTHSLHFSHDDEIKKIGLALMQMEKDLNKEIISRNELLRAVTHELKTPLAHIVTLMFLHKNEVDQYKDFDFIESEVKKIIDENNELIQVTLNSLDSPDKLKQHINLKALIEDKIKMFEVYHADKDIDLQLENFVVEANPVPLNLVLNNLLLNASKYSDKYLSVKNVESKIIIVNDFIDNSGHGVGKTIIKRLSEAENYRVSTEQHDGVYTTIIDII